MTKNKQVLGLTPFILIFAILEVTARYMVLPAVVVQIVEWSLVLFPFLLVLVLRHDLKQIVGEFKADSLASLKLTKNLIQVMAIISSFAIGYLRVKDQFFYISEFQQFFVTYGNTFQLLCLIFYGLGKLLKDKNVWPYIFGFLQSIFGKYNLPSWTKYIPKGLEWGIKNKKQVGIAFVTYTVLFVFFTFFATIKISPNQVITDAVQDSNLGKDHQEKAITVYFTTPGSVYFYKKGDEIIMDKGELIIDFSQYPYDLEKKVKIEDAVIINPPIAGKWKKYGDTRYGFTPKALWIPGEKYNVLVKEDNLKNKLKLGNNVHEFTTDRYSLRISTKKFYVNPKDPSQKRVVIHVNGNYPIDANSLESKINFIVKNHKGKRLKELKGKVKLDEIGTTAYIHSDDFNLRDKEQKVDILIDSGVGSSYEVKGTKNTEETSLNIPSKYSFMNIDIRDIKIEKDPKTDVPYHSFHLLSNTDLDEKELLNHLQVFELPIYPGPEVASYLEKLWGTDYNQCFRYINYNTKKMKVDWSRCGESIDNKMASLVEKKEISFIEKKYLDAQKFELTFDTKVGNYYLVRLREGFQSKQGYRLKYDLENKSQAPEFPKEIKLANKGSVISLNGSHKLSVYTRGIRKLKYELKQLLPNQIQHILSLSNGDKMNPSFHNYNFTADNITKKIKGEIPLGFDLKKGGYTDIDLSQYLDDRDLGGQKNHGIFFISLKDEGDRSFHNQIIFVSDMAYIMKKDNFGDRDIYILSSTTGRPLTNVKVKKVFTNGITKQICTTGDQGHCKLPEKSIKGNGFILQRGDDILFSRYNDWSTEVNFTRFDVGGEYNYGDDVKAFVYSDRKLYRPGEKAHLGIIVKDKKWSSSYVGEWIKVEITDPRGTIFYSKNHQIEKHGYQSLAMNFPYTAPTGDYKVKVAFKGSGRYYNNIGFYTLKVQEFLPDKLKLAVNFNQNYEYSWVSTKDLAGLVSLRNLFGTAAVGNRVEAKISLAPSELRLPKFSGYEFSRQNTLDEYKELNLSEQKTDDMGQIKYDFDLSPYSKAQFRLDFVVEGFMKAGGRSVIGRKSILVSNSPYMVGLKLPKNRYFITSKSKAIVKMIAVNNLQKSIAAKNLKLSLYEKKYQNSLVKQADGTFAYQDTKEPTLYKKLDLSIAAGSSEYTIENTKIGEFIAKIEDEDGKVLNEFDYTVVGEADLARSLAQSAELKLSLNKTDFKPGEMATINIKAPYRGHGLITVERDKIYASKWFKLNAPTGNVSIKIPAELEGNAYINVSMLRDTNSKKVFTSPYTYGVLNFTIDKSKRKLAIDIDAPLNVKPGQTVKIKYKSSRKAKLILYGADEGILQLAQYRKPNPLNYFFRKQALQVTTFELFSLILPEADMVKEAFAAGGGFGKKAGKNINPFKRRFTKAVAFWSDLVESNPEWSEYEYLVPSHFNGTLRVFAVAVNDSAIGVQQRQVYSKDDVIISPTVPTFLAPGDKVELAASITNNLPGSEKSDELEVSLNLGPGLKLVDERLKTLTIEKNRDQVVRYKVMATEKLGNAKIEFFVDHKNGRSRFEENLSVRPLNPFIRRSWRSMLVKGDVSLKVDGQGYYKEFFSGDITLTSGFWALIKGGIRNLAKYPYGCSEQITSKAVPYLYFTDEDLQINPKEKQAFLAKTFDSLLERQNSNGSIDLYPGGYKASDFVNLYIAKFLIRAKQKNIDVPEILYTRMLKYVESIIENGTDLYRANAFYLLAMAEKQIGAKLKIFAKEQYRNDLVNLYLAGTFKKLEDNDKAYLYLSKVDPKFKAFKMINHYYSSSSLNNLYVEIVSENFPDKMEDKFDERVEQMVNDLTRNGTNSLISAQIIMALNDYAKEKVLKDIPIKVAYHKGEAKTIDSSQIKSLTKDISNVKALEFELPEDKKYFFALDIFGFNKNLKPFKKGVQIKKRILNLAGQEVDSAKIGEELIVELSIQADSRVEDAVIVDLIPGGFDLVWKKWENMEFSSTVSKKFEDKREDRMILYLSADTDLQKYYYKIKAVSKVEAQVPGSYFENMYKTKEQALSAASKIIIKE